MSFYWRVAVKAPIFKLLTYSSKEDLPLGSFVEVPLGKKKVRACVVAKASRETDKNIKAIHLIYEDIPNLSLSRIQWLTWLAQYYHYPIGMVFDLCRPPLKPKKTKEVENKTSTSKPITLRNVLTKDQDKIFQSISKNKNFQAHLIHGVTGSGKTEIYKALAKHFLEKGEQVLILLPEIFLSLQIKKRFEEEFGEEIVLFHSGLTPRQKTQAWFDILEENKRILIGTRSALFCPLPKLGLIILDEEHVSSFKQEDKFRYHARDSALKLAQIINKPCVLGSASPSFDSWQRAEEGLYKMHKLEKRASDSSLPSVKLVDLKKSPLKDKIFWLSEELYLGIERALQQKKQVSLFLNRRGQASSLLCRSCGDVRYCPGCDIALTLHENEYLLCHYCDHVEKKSKTCLICKSQDWLEKGVGTEKVEEVLSLLFPKARIFRADRDNIDSKKAMENLLEQMEKGLVDIIIGTQMLAKGLNFPNIQLVGILMADMGFHFPDFRAGEKSFQNLLQMAGRSGRRDPGEVLVQTFNPTELNISYLKNHDYQAFLQEEMKNRKKFFYPPFSRLCLFQIDSLDEEKGSLFAFDLAKKARANPSSFVQILGPSPSPLFRLRGLYRFQLLVKARNHEALQAFLDHFLPQIKETKSSRVKIDRDPVSML